MGKTKGRNKKRFFFLLFILAVLATPLAIAMNLGGTESVPAIYINVPTPANHPLISTFRARGSNIFIDINAPAAPNDTWLIKDNRLVFALGDEDTVTALALEDSWLGQQIGYYHEKGLAHVVIELDNLPPIVQVHRTNSGYRIELTDSGLSGKRIAIDPGHGGHDPGAVGHYLRLQEKDVTLAVALELNKLLSDAGAEVFMTRSTDTLVNTNVKPGQHIRPDLWMRRDIVNEWSPDFFVSIHNNSWSDRVAGGIETYYNRTSLNSFQSRTAASLIQQRLVAEFQRRDRGIKYKQSSDAVLQVDFPAVLCEVLFISNRAEEAMLADSGFAKRAAQAIFDGINVYFGGGGDGQ